MVGKRDTNAVTFRGEQWRHVQRLLQERNEKRIPQFLNNVEDIIRKVDYNWRDYRSTRKWMTHIRTTRWKISIKTRRENHTSRNKQNVYRPTVTWTLERIRLGWTWFPSFREKSMKAVFGSNWKTTHYSEYVSTKAKTAIFRKPRMDGCNST